MTESEATREQIQRAIEGVSALFERKSNEDADGMSISSSVGASDITEQTKSKLISKLSESEVTSLIQQHPCLIGAGILSALNQLIKQDLTPPTSSSHESLHLATQKLQIQLQKLNEAKIENENGEERD